MLFLAISILDSDGLVLGMGYALEGPLQKHSQAVGLSKKNKKMIKSQFSRQFPYLMVLF